MGGETGKVGGGDRAREEEGCKHMTGGRVVLTDVDSIRQENRQLSLSPLQEG
jgi:hypothetical protein